jgi:hypothetical protein
VSLRFGRVLVWAILMLCREFSKRDKSKRLSFGWSWRMREILTLIDGLLNSEPKPLQSADEGAHEGRFPLPGSHPTGDIMSS